MVLLTQIFRTCVYQFALAGAVTIVWWVFAGAEALPGAICGALTALLPGLMLGSLMSAATPRRDARAALTAFYVGVAVKLLLTAALFITAIAVLKVDFPPLMTVYAAGLMGYWIALARVTPVRRGRIGAFLGG